MSLSEQIASLINPVPVFQDPEDDHDKDTVAKVVDFEETEDVCKSGHGTKSLIRARAAALLNEGDTRYAGKKTSRKILQKTVGNYAHISPDDDDDDVSDDSLGGVEAEAVHHFKQRMLRRSGRVYDQPSDDSDSNDQSDSEEVHLKSQPKVEGTDQSKQDETETTMISGGHHLAEDAEKGRAIKRQLSLWDALLKSRIQMQKVMLAANQLPQHDVWNVFCDKGGQNFADVVEASGEKVKCLLDSLVDLQTSLLAANSETRSVLDSNNTGTTHKRPSEEPNNEEIPSDTEDEADKETERNLKEIIRRHKRIKLTEDEYQTFLEKRHCDFQPYRDVTIQKWNERTKLTTGKMKSFDKFEQSTLKQIEHILYDKARLIKRTQMKRNSYAVLGRTAEATPTSARTEKNGNEVAAVVPTASELEDADVEIFDDNDFYHQILRELIERKTVDVSDSVTLGRQWLQIQKLRSKMKRKVDTKASKGRKIRYDVHAKLVNFLAPIDTTTLSDEAKNELFNSLFGKKFHKE